MRLCIWVSKTVIHGANGVPLVCKRPSSPGSTEQLKASQWSLENPSFLAPERSWHWWPSKGPWERRFLITVNPFSHHSHKLTSEIVVLANLTDSFSKQEPGKVIALSSLLSVPKDTDSNLPASAPVPSSEISSNHLSLSSCALMSSLQFQVQILAPAVWLVQESHSNHLLSCHGARGQVYEVFILSTPQPLSGLNSYYY